MIGKKITSLVDRSACLNGRDISVSLSGKHAVTGRVYTGGVPDGKKRIVFGMGCFWGAERLFWTTPGVYTTAVGYAGGVTENPSYEEVCSGMTNHTEVVIVVYNPEAVSLDRLLKAFWEGHDPTQGMRQGNDTGTQYRSAIYVDSDGDLAHVMRSRDSYQRALTESKCGVITTEIGRLDTLFYAEEMHQQYLHKVPNGYCGLAGTSVRYTG